MFKQEEGMFPGKVKGEGIWEDNTNTLLRNRMRMIVDNLREKTYNV